MLVPERRILVYVIGMMAGIAFAADMGVAGQGATLAATGVAVLSGWAALRGRIGGWRLGPRYFAVVMLAWCSAGMILPARDDGVLLARGEAKLVLASAGDTAAISATTGRPGRQLSGFLADSVGRQLAQPVSLDLAEKTGRITQHKLRDGRQIAIVTRRRDLSQACRQTVRMVISLVVADYPCRSDVPLVSLAGLPRGNYRLSINDRGITARASNGQYLRISPVSRP